MMILLPAWHKVLSAHGLPPCIMPWDISTCWNSTFDMLKFTIWYHVTIDVMTAIWEYDLCKYKLGSAEWNIAKELWEALKVSNWSPSFLSLIHTAFSRSSKMQCCFFLMTPLTLPLFFLPWDLLMISWLQHLIYHPSSALQSMPPLPSVKRPWISITREPGNWMSIALQWVSSFLFLYTLYILTAIHHISSPPPLLQAGVLQEKPLGCLVNQESPQHGSRRIQQNILAVGHWGGW